MRFALLLSLLPLSVLSRTTIVDVLSQDSQFSSLLHLLQRARLIPTLNRLPNATFFAPTNDAIEKWNTDHPGHDSGGDDNIHERLRQHLFYHLLNYSLSDSELSSTLPLPLETLLYPSIPLEPPTNEPPPSPPWLPVPGGLLNGQGQRLRIASRSGQSYVGVDAFAHGGSHILKEPIQASNGIVLPIGGVIPEPADLVTTISQHPVLSTFNRFLTTSVKQNLSTSPHITLFFPLDTAWDALDPIERLYLDSGFAEKDIERLVAMHSISDGIDGNGTVGWSENWRDGDKFTTTEGDQLRIGFSPDGSVQIDNSTVVQPDIYASNGVLHIVSSLLIPPGAFQLNVEKSLLALNCTQFVSLLRSANLSHYIDDEHDGSPWTILAPRDDIFSFHYGSSLKSGKPPMFPDLHRVLKYHIIPGKLNPDDLTDKMLVGTELREVGLGGGRQRLIVSVGGKNGRVTYGKSGNGELGFGGGMVIGEPVKVGDSMIYLISKVLEPPPPVMATIMPNAHLSTFLASIYASSLSSVLDSEPSTTILVPPNSAFDDLGLLTTHLLLSDPDSKRDLSRVVKHHVLKAIVYSKDLNASTTLVSHGTYATLEGSDVRLADGIVTPSGGWSVPAPVDTTKDTLTQTGVMHELLSGVLIPRSVKVGLTELIKAAKGGTMHGLIIRAGFEGVLNGTLKLDQVEGWRPEDLEDRWDWDWNWSWRWPWEKSKVDKGKKTNAENGWALLVPTDDAFKSVNLTRLLNDQDALRRLVMQHIIPIFPTSTPSPVTSPAHPIPFVDSATYSTLLTPNSLHGSITFRATTNSKSSFLIGIQGSRSRSQPEDANDYAEIISYGRTTYPTSIINGVIQINRVLDPWMPGWWVAWGQAIAFGIFGILGVGVFWGVVGWFWWKDEEEATYEPLYGEDE